MTQLNDGTVSLPSSLDLAGAETLCRDLRTKILAAQPIALEGSQVERVSTSSIQVLLAALRGAEARSLSFKLEAPSKAMTDAMADLGVETLFSAVRS